MNYAANPKVAAIQGVPGKSLGIWAISLCVVLPVGGIVLGVIGLLQSRRAGVSNNLAIAGIAISTAVVLAAVITTIAIWA